MLTLMLLAAITADSPAVGKRPYELEWAGRTTDAQPPLIDFEHLDGWTADTKESEAKLELTREQQIWGDHVAKLTYRGTGKQPTVTLRPPQPVACPAGFDTVTLWCYGNNWGWTTDPNTPQVALIAHFETPKGHIALRLYQVDWEEWNLLHRKLTAEQAGWTQAGATFVGLEVSGGRNKDDRVLFFDNLATFREETRPLAFKARPQRGIDLFPGEDPGINTGPGRLPFPTRPETILPPNLTPGAKSSVRALADAYEFTYQGADTTVTWVVTTSQGNFNDVTVQVAGGPRVRPLVDGGIVLANGKPPEQHKLLEAKLAQDALTTRWQLSGGGLTATATYTYRLWGKTLVIDTVCPGGNVADVRYGRAAGLVQPKLVQVPYYVYSPGRPMVAASGTPEQPLFLAGNTDWYLSNASELYGAAAQDGETVTYNGGARYIAKTDGRRNDCYERFFVTISPKLEEVLPTIPNPVSPWKDVTGTGVWLAHGAGNRETDAAHFREAKRYGLDKLIITDHETMWRDNGESFTFRTRTAPGRGGDESAQRYSRILQDELGYVYGPYNNFTDFAPLNEFWSPDRVSRWSDGNLQHAWMRCYAPKPIWAVSMCEELSPINQRKFKFSTAYCDVHTAVAPWHRTDYDARTPGAGTFSQVLYAYGEIMLLQKQAWGGPVYSEGGHHCFLHGLTDGNYGQDQDARLPDNPWLVDFDLLRLHNLGCNFGMGAPDMFYGSGKSGKTAAERNLYVDRFLAATVGFGHPGFLVQSGWDISMRSYYMVQGLASAYTRQPATAIRYVSADGELQDSSKATVAGTIARQQVAVTYANGVTCVANGSTTLRLKAKVGGRDLDLPPGGYAGWDPKGGLEVFAGEVAGARVDEAETPAYRYVDGRGQYVRRPKACSNGPAACVKRDAGWELIPFGTADAGFDLGGTATAIALDRDRKELGPAEVRYSRQMVWVMPVAGAFSYRLKPLPRPAVGLTADRWQVTPGEVVTVRGQGAYRFTVPTDAKPGTHLWHHGEAAWIDFVVVPAADLAARLEGNRLVATITSHLPQPVAATVTLGDQTRTATLVPGVASEVAVDLPAPQEERVDTYPVAVKLGEVSVGQALTLRVVKGHHRLGAMAAGFVGGMAFRGRPETSNTGDMTAAGVIVHPEDSLDCGTVRTRQAGTLMFFMHPPWQGGVGYAFARLAPVALPAGAPQAVRAMVGKRDGSDLGDGILFKLAVVDAAGKESVVGQQTVTTHEWKPIEGDLTPWAGQTVELKLIADVGPANDSGGDWSCWADVRVETRDELPVRQLDPHTSAGLLLPPPLPLVDLKAADLKTLKSATLHYEGIGLEGVGRYASVAVLNGIELGNMAGSGGDETKGVWGAATVPLTPAALASLKGYNRFEVRNDGQDYFKVRRAWLELELADGRKASSKVAASTYTQPPGWQYEEGVAVPFGESITFELWIDLAP